MQSLVNRAALVLQYQPSLAAAPRVTPRTAPVQLYLQHVMMYEASLATLHVVPTPLHLYGQSSRMNQIESSSNRTQ